VAAETRSRVAASGLTVRELPALRDLDTLEDLRGLWPRLEGLLEGRPALRAALRHHVDVPG
jgi:hypothetical protein